MAVAAVLIGGVIGLAGVYGIGRLRGNAEPDPACQASVDTARRMTSLARGEVAAVAVAAAPRTLPALTFALTIDRVLNGLCRPFFGWVSDMIGRENTMFIAFAMEALAVWVMLLTRENPALFAVMSGIVFFGWGEIFSLFPSTLTDTFGTKNATTNFGFLYISQGVGSVLGGPAAAWMHDATGSWFPVFWLIIALDSLTAVLALFVLKRARAGFLARQLNT